MTRAERTYYVVYGLYCSSWSTLTPVYPLFLLSRGLDLFEINLVFATYLLVAFFFEVPTGAIADVFGRKTSFLLSCAVRGVAFMMYWYAQGFADCLVAEFADGVGTTLASGALDAWVVDSVRDAGDAAQVGRIFARAGFWASPMMIVGGLFGSYVADVDLGMAWPCGAALFLATGVVAFFWMEENRLPATRRESLWRSWLDTSRAGLVVVRRSPVLRVLCLLTAATSFAVMPAWHYWPARLQQLSGAGVWLLGWVWALITLASMAGNVLMPRLVPRFSRQNVLAVAWLWRGAMLAIGALSNNLSLAVGAVLAMQAVYGLSEPTLQGWMNEHAGSEQRATVLSARSMAFTFGGGAGLVCLGLLGRAYGITAVWAASAILVILIAPGFLWLSHKPALAASGQDRKSALPTVV
ncbi:MAG TPA: MFS transporter [Candidatus Acidoferrales bacterium]|nr:MFS transporter [Candidatus Acidoferrales bacterium]